MNYKTLNSEFKKNTYGDFHIHKETTLDLSSTHCTLERASILLSNKHSVPRVNIWSYTPTPELLSALNDLYQHDITTIMIFQTE